MLPEFLAKRSMKAAEAPPFALRFAKIAIRCALFPSYRRDPLYRARTQALVDVLQGRFGEYTGDPPTPAVAEVGETVTR